MGEKRKLSEVLVEIMLLTDKYDFDMKDRLTVMDRMLLLGEACAFLEELGLFNELKERHRKVCEESEEVLTRL